MKTPIQKPDQYSITANKGIVYFLIGKNGKTIGSICGQPDKMIELANEIIECAEQAKRNSQ